jgi:alpha-N-arabinofuranosidase
MNIRIDTEHTEALSPYIFGHNLEHTRSAVGSGLSAQMLRNRKFAGKPAKNSGVAAEWRGIGDRTFFQLGGRECYTRHIGCARMHRANELQSQSAQNVHGGRCGIAQDGLTLSKGTGYEVRCIVKCSAPVKLTAALTDRRGKTFYAGREFALEPGEWRTAEALLTAPADDDDASIRFTFSERAEVIFGAVSMMAEGHFHGMRADVVRCLKEIGPTILRWPGGNFAGEYRWMDGLLPSDQRGPLQAATEIETQPHSHGYDFHEISTDDFVALCREIGAEPFLTINLFWNTPQDSADWVEYCNGGPETEYGRRRAENGSPEPYGVRFWSLGNEMGYGHMEGPMQPDDYAALAAEHVRAMTAVTPDLELFSSGPYPNRGWAERSAAKLAPAVKYTSLHHYHGAAMDYTTPEKIEETYRNITSGPDSALRLARDMRSCLDGTGEKLLISFDEWNVWYAWYRPSCAGEGIFTAKMLHRLIRESNELGMPVCCYFQPVGEGAVLVDSRNARLTANGQMFAMMKEHCGGQLCRAECTEDGQAEATAATVKDGVLTVTLINDSYDRERSFALECGGGTVTESRLYASDEVTPYTFFTERPLEWETGENGINVILPPHSAGILKIAAG